jgi:hypothetical protein
VTPKPAARSAPTLHCAPDRHRLRLSPAERSEGRAAQEAARWTAPIASVGAVHLYVAEVRRDQRSGAGHAVGFIERGALLGRCDRHHSLASPFLSKSPRARCDLCIGLARPELHRLKPQARADVGSGTFSSARSHEWLRIDIRGTVFFLSVFGELRKDVHSTIVAVIDRGRPIREQSQIPQTIG